MKNPAYVVLARKYRPQAFEDVLGQDAVSVTLKNALSSKRLAHAYLFTGPRGVGKTTMARLLAKALNCAEGPTANSCGKCDSCREIASSSSIDVLEMDAASHTGVDNVREVIIETVALAPSRDRYKVFIIDEAHMLSTPAFNALLKTIEEPPAHVVFILATTESVKVPATIASRCQRFKFRPISVDVLSAHLGALAKKEKISIDEDALDLLARSAAGSLRDAVSLLDQSHTFSEKKITVELVREMFGFVPQDMLLGVGQALFSKDGPALGRWLQKIYEEGVEPSQLLRDLREALEAVYLGRLGVSEVPQFWKPLAQNAAASEVGHILRRVNKTLEELRVSDSPRLTLELGLFGCLEAAGDLESWVGRLEALERRLAASGSEPSRPLTPAPMAAGTAGKSESSRPPVENPAPQAAPAAGGVVWPSVVAALQEKPSLAAALQGARMTVISEASWKLVFRREFDLKTAERSLPAIEAVLATKAGRKISLLLEAGGAGAAAEPSEVVDEGIPDAPAAAPESGVWRDVTASAPAAGADTPLKNAEKILGGTVRFIKKK